MPLNPGTKLGPYVVDAALGAGGMGEVYRAKDARLDRTVAIKVLPSANAGDPEFRARFEREARAARRRAGKVIVSGTNPEGVAPHLERIPSGWEIRRMYWRPHYGAPH
jgi:serine/threonine protein kinase